MILGLAYALRSLRCVGMWRCLAALGVALGMNFLEGVIVSALLGVQKGKA